MQAVINFWHKEPFVRLLLCLVAGIIPALYTPLYLPPWLIIILALLIITLCITGLLIHPKINVGYLYLPALVILGFIVTRLQDTGAAPDAITKVKPVAKYYIGYVCDDIEQKNGKLHTRVEITHYVAGDYTLKPASGKILLYTAPLSGLCYGSRLCIDAQAFRDKLSNGNPYEFDYAAFLYRQHILGIAIVKPGQIFIGKIVHTNIFKSLIFKFNNYTLSQIEQYIPDKETRGITAALINGDKTNIEEATIQAYTDCGVIHVMAVSGTQVALIYLLIDALFFAFRRHKRRSLWQWLLTLIFIWVFTAMAGFSGSVLRAAVMFSFISLGQYLNRPTGIYNMLAASAFFIFIFDAYAIADVGLQLSYAAIWGIVFLHIKIYPLLKISNKFLQYAWKMTSVSISAQIFTLPLILYYFHQFPLFFIPANIIAIPVTTLALYLGIFLVLSGSVFPALAKLLGLLLVPLIHSLNAFLLALQSMPGAVFYSGLCTIPEVILVAIVLGSIISYLIWRYKISFYVFITGLAMFVSLHTMRAISAQKNGSIVIFNTGYKKRAFSIIHNNSAVLLIDTSGGKNGYFINNYFTRYRHIEGIKDYGILPYK